MRKDHLIYINGKDAWLTWSAMLIEDSYTNLRMPAGLKTYVENDFRSAPGKRVIIKNPQPTSRDVQLTFAITCDSTEDYFRKFDSLIEEMTGKIFELKVIPLMTSYKVYLSDNCFLSLSEGTGFRDGKLSVRVNEPNPTDRKTGNEVLEWIFKDGIWQKGYWLKGGRWGMDMEE